MIIIDKITKKEDVLLRDYDVVIDDHDYSADELDYILGVLQDAELDHIDDWGNKSDQLTRSYAELHDKFFGFCEAQYYLERPEEELLRQEGIEKFEIYLENEEVDLLKRIFGVNSKLRIEGHLNSLIYMMIDDWKKENDIE